jgi:DNA-directed RNA polymerase specialized sigma24 family protein
MPPPEPVPKASDDPSVGSVTRWIDELRGGDDGAAEALWDRYFARLIGLAREQLAGTPRRMADEEDAALSAFYSLVAGVQQGRFPDLGDRDGLWRLLAVITVRKARGQVRYLRRDRRGGGRPVLGEADLAAVDGMERGLDVIADPGLVPDLAASLAEECRRRLDALGDGLKQQVAILAMEGYTDPEIARRIGRSRATVARKLADIRATWREELAGVQGEPER